MRRSTAVANDSSTAAAQSCSDQSLCSGCRVKLERFCREAQGSAHRRALRQRARGHGRRQPANCTRATGEHWMLSSAPLTDDPGVLAAAGLRGVDHELVLLESHAAEASGHQLDLVAAEREGTEVDVTRFELSLDHGRMA